MSTPSLREALQAVSWRDCGWRWLPLAALLIIADQVSKGWIETHFSLGESTPLFFWLDITRLHNPGAAFSFLAGAGGWQRWALSMLAVVVSGLLVLWLRTLHARREGMLAAALALVIAGAIGNVIDRLEHGYVVDFIHVHWQQAYFPAFNIADSAITIGAALLLLDAFADWRRSRRGGGTGSADPGSGGAT
ncbi:MAG: lipoprotein signal peptidase [Gammaproteobacteria bacterium]|nr:lipoprotein signal peptidase [Gammaproteobacteria bacterium]